MILKWGCDTIVTIDLVPVFPVKVEQCKDVTQLFNIVTKTLITRQPENWLKHLKSVIQWDQILPESILSITAANHSNDLEVGFKILHYGPEDNAIIRPAQILDVADFKKFPKETRQVYCIMKYLKDTLKVQVKSYLLKKVVLLDQFVNMASEGCFAEDLLFEVLNYSEVKKIFKGKIDYQKWRNEKSQGKMNGIPLL